jgi:hypothetical protein
MDAPDASSPDLITFTATEKTWEGLSEDERRDAIVSTLEQTVNFGVADVPAGRHAAYGDIIAPGEADGMRQALLQKTSANSSCGLLVRSVWRFLGATDHLLDPPYKPGLVITNLLKYATANGALTKPTSDTFDPKKGDVLYVTAANDQHIFTITDVNDDGTIIHSIDGGQRGINGVDDGGCNCIQRRSRTLDKETLTFDDGKKIADWVDVTKLPFTAPIIELAKLMSDDDVKPG